MQGAVGDYAVVCPRGRPFVEVALNRNNVLPEPLRIRERLASRDEIGIQFQTFDAKSRLPRLTTSSAIRTSVSPASEPTLKNARRGLLLRL